MGNFTSLRTRHISILLIGITFFLTLISFLFGCIVVSQHIDSGIWEMVFKLFNVDFERNIPTWYSVMLLGMVGISYIIVAYSTRLLKKAYFLQWLLLGLIFLAISLDEFGQLHEQSIRPLRDYLDTGGFLYYPWIIPAAILTLIVGALYFSFIQNLRWGTRWLFILAGLLYVGGALGMEAIGGYYFDTYVRPGEASYDYIYLILTHIEEFCEMLGSILFLHVGLYYLQMIISSPNHED